MPTGQGDAIGQDLGPAAASPCPRAMPATASAHGHGSRIDNLFDRNHSQHLNPAGSADFGCCPADPVRIGEPRRSAWLTLDLSD
ncbi:hypothetical protein ABU614_06570 [Lysobacter firmicutimachus]|uniref:Uncharacterized protein n=1 Tax=Lysobacter firmicutimachus TaxID=1792846 RepID=A0AAU8MXK2_9GAMM